MPYTYFKVCDMPDKNEFIDAAKNGNILLRVCDRCGCEHTSTVYFCRQCGSSQMSSRTTPGRGRIVTYTIITVPPAGFEKYTPYAFVVMSLEDTNLRISGFMGGIATPDDLPVGTEAQVAGHDGRGLLIDKL